MTVMLSMTDTSPIAPMWDRAVQRGRSVLIGRRFQDDGPEIILPGLEWQMPQGGIDADEDPREAVMRELWEETGVVQRQLSRRNRLADLRISAVRWTVVAPAREIPRPAPEMVRAALHRTRRRNRSADAAQRPTGGVRPVAMGAARPRRRSRRAVPARGLSDRGAAFCGIRGDACGNRDFSSVIARSASNEAMTAFEAFSSEVGF